MHTFFYLIGGSFEFNQEWQISPSFNFLSFFKAYHPIGIDLISGSLKFYRTQQFFLYFSLSFFWVHHSVTEDCVRGNDIRENELCYFSSNASPRMNRFPEKICSAKWLRSNLQWQSGELKRTIKKEENMMSSVKL